MTLMRKLTYREMRWIKRLRRRESDEPAFVTQNKKEMIKLIKAGKADEIVFDEWGHVHYDVDENSD